MSSVGMGNFVIAVSENGENGWKLLKPAEVPEWLKNPDVLGQMREGFIAHNDKAPDGWYCAVQVPDFSKPKSEIIGAEGRRIVMPEGHA